MNPYVRHVVIVVSSAVLLLASLASLLAVGLVIVTASTGANSASPIQIGLCVASVVCSWAVVHTVFTLRYAHEYYATSRSGDSPTRIGNTPAGETPQPPGTLEGFPGRGRMAGQAPTSSRMRRAVSDGVLPTRVGRGVGQERQAQEQEHGQGRLHG